MNKKEAEKVLKIMKTVDGGCVYCSGKLFNLFVKEFTEFRKLAEDIFKEEFGEELKEEEK